MTIDRRTLISGALTFASVGSTGAKAAAVEPKEVVLGIGGVFFRSHDPTALAEWYRANLGINPPPTDIRQPVWKQAAGPTIFSPFPAATTYFGSPQQVWMLNFRVRSLDAMVAQLRAAKIVVTVDSEIYPNGRFARLQDPDGNPIELWEPVP